MEIERIDIYPTHEHRGYKLRPGKPYPFGATIVNGGVNFSVFSKHASYCTLVLFDKGASEPKVEIPFRGMFERPETKEPFWGDFRIGAVYSMVVFDLDPEEIEYGFRMDAPYDSAKKGEPGFHRFDHGNILLDPYAKSIGGREVWGEQPDWNDIYQHRARIVQDDFDWEDDRPLEIPMEDLVIYEAHVRSFTRHESSGVRFPGTFAGLREKIPYLKELGINCLELMPIYEFDEFENSRESPITGETLMNYWGYSTVGFFAPKAGFAAMGKSKDGTMVADELKNLIKELHLNGIEVILDVVFNHTAEGNEFGPTISFRGIDNVTYYMLTPEGYYYNFSGTGNTLNCNNPVVRGIVLDCLRYWASEFHIDGFRFDLAAILGRDQNGAPLPNPPLLEILAHDPILAKCKLIAEAWDAGGLYQVGSFPAYGRWAEWNGKYRDAIRQYLKGDMGLIGEMSQRLQGSPDLYSSRGTTASINFITCHDGFTLYDTVSYNDKHNDANGEGGADGANDNNSWNCGWEGETDDPAINALRKKQIKNAFAMLLTSQGVPMMLMGDEVARTKYGNNNTYCQDNDLNWLDWEKFKKHEDLYRFVRNCIAFRHEHYVLRNRWHLRNEDYVGSGYPDISWHGTTPWQPDWDGTSRLLAFMLCGKHARGGTEVDNYIYVATNMHWEGHEFGLPMLPDGMQWHVFANTGMPSPDDIASPGHEPRLEDQSRFFVGDRSVVILVGK
ncbi:MAG: glycogen debranching enzyme GlgX [Ectothiorhodospiraceae bacterium]|nr:glycogen debranching enzyme GlgX [Ectothiorhodospiraceae bacterium]